VKWKFKHNSGSGLLSFVTSFVVLLLRYHSSKSHGIETERKLLIKEAVKLLDYTASAADK
jgi:hypothetical protein